MKFHFVTLLTIIALLSSCSEKHTESDKNTGDSSSAVQIIEESGKPKLYVQTLSIIAGDSGNRIANTITVLDIKDVKISLTHFTKANGEDGYRAGKSIEKPKEGEAAKVDYFDIADSKGKIMEFKTPDEFLAFMSERGYEMTAQASVKDRFDYTFEKK